MEAKTKEIIIDLLLSMDVALNPECYPSSKNLGPEDFLDLATCKASETGLLNEFNEARIKYGFIES